jgi:hypothetical protein
MQIAGNTLKDRAASEVKYYSQGGDPYGMNVARMDSNGGWIATRFDDVLRSYRRVQGYGPTA